MTDSFWIKGEGMTRRSHNIDEIKNMILSGMSYRDIQRKACRYFTLKKFDEYYQIASDEIEAESVKNGSNSDTTRKEEVIHQKMKLGLSDKEKELRSQYQTEVDETIRIGGVPPTFKKWKLTHSSDSKKDGGVKQ